MQILNGWLFFLAILLLLYMALSQVLLPTDINNQEYQQLSAAEELWKEMVSPDALQPSDKNLQAKWDEPIYNHQFTQLLDRQDSPEEKARLLAVASEQGRHSRHKQANDLIGKAVASADVLVAFEPLGLSPTDNECPLTIPLSLEPGENPCLGLHMQRYSGLVQRHLHLKRSWEVSPRC